MARIVMRTAIGPHEVTVGSETTFICGCGLSKNQPFCDDSHKLTRGEEANKLYWYDDSGQRHEVADDFRGIRTF